MDQPNQASHFAAPVLGYASHSAVAVPQLVAAQRLMIIWGIVDAFLACPVGMLAVAYILESQRPSPEKDLDLILGVIALAVAGAFSSWSVSCFILRKGMIAGKGRAFVRAIGMTHVAMWSVAIVLLVITLIGLTLMISANEWGGMTILLFIDAILVAIAQSIRRTKLRLIAAKGEAR